MNKKIMLIVFLLSLIVCTGCENNKKLICKKYDDNNNSVEIIEWSPKKVTVTFETTYSSEKEALDTLNFYKERFPEYEVSVNGNVFVSKITEDTDDEETYADAKKDLEDLGFTCE